jgi:hypothetical protein
MAVQSVTAAYKKNSAKNISKCMFEETLQLITAKPQYNATSNIPHQIT